MKTIKLLATEFVSFRKLAIASGIAFTCNIYNGVYTIQAKHEDLIELGYEGD